VNADALSARVTRAVTRPSGTAIGIALIATLGAVLLSAWVSRAAFYVFAVLVLALVAHAAHRWPRATLVSVALVTLADPYAIRGMIPAGLQFIVFGFSEVLLAVVGIVIGVGAVRRRAFMPALRDPVLVIGLLFVAVSVVSALANAVPPVVAVLGIVVTVDAVAAYFLARMLPFERRSVARAVGGLVGLALLASLVGIAQALLAPDLLWFTSFAGRFGEGGRVTGILGNPNMLAAVISLATPYVVFATLHLPDRRTRWAAAGILFVLLLALVLTFSRGAWAAAILGLVVGTLLLDWRALLVTAAVAVLAYLAAAFMPRYVLVPADQLPWYAPSGQPNIIGSTIDRFEELAGSDLRLRFVLEALPIIHDNLLLGTGPGRYGGAVAKVTDSPVYAEYGTSVRQFRTVHNFWLHLLGEVGILGMSLFAAAIVGLGIRFRRAARRASGIEFILLAGVTTAVVITLLNNVTEMIFEGNVPGIVVWLFLGLGSMLAPLGLLDSTGESRPGGG
jgi:O-antigen ligase